MAADNSQTNSAFFMAGLIAGPLFIGVGLILGFFREGFEMVRHPLSLLSVGEGGWMQISSFVLAGVLYIVAAIGLRRAQFSGVGAKWGPRLLVAMAAGLIMGGVFTADPSLGFPPGTPAGIPPTMSWHAAVHGFAPILGFMALLAFHLVIARRFKSQGRSGWMAVSIVIGVGSFLLSAVPNFTADYETGTFNFLPLWFGSG